MIRWGGGRSPRIEEPAGLLVIALGIIACGLFLAVVLLVGVLVSR